MITAQTPAIVERGVNLIYQHDWATKWYQSNDGTYSACVGYESKQWRVERYKVTIPEIKYGTEVEKALSLQVNFTGTSGSKYKMGHGEETIRTYDYWITDQELPSSLLMKSDNANTDMGRHGEFSFTNETYPSANFTIRFDEGAGLAPGTYYLFIYRDSSTFHWRHWNDHVAPQIIVETRGYSKCSTVTSAIIQGNPKYFSTIKEGTSFTLAWAGAEAGINNDIAGYKLEYSCDNKQTWSILDEKVIETSYEVKGSEWKSHQGKTFYFRITTLGKSTSSSDGNWDSTSVEFATSIKANKPPVIESLTAPYAIYWPNKLDATDSDKYLNLSCVYINDEFDQTVEYQIGESASYLPSLKIDLSNEQAGEKTFTIRLYDGYDKSEPKQVKIQIIKTELVECSLNLKNGMKYTWGLYVDKQISAYDDPETIAISIDVDGKNKNKSFVFGDTFKIADVLNDILIDGAKNYDITATIYKNYRGALYEIGRAIGSGAIEAPQKIENATFDDKTNQYVIDPFYSNLAIPIEKYDSSAQYGLIAINANGTVASDVVSIQGINKNTLTATIDQTKFNDRDYCALHFQKIVEGLTISSVFSVRFGYRPNLVGTSINWGTYVCNPFEIGRDQEGLSINTGIRNPFGVLSAYNEGLYRIKEVQLIIEDGLSEINPTKTEVIGETLSLTFNQKELARSGFDYTKIGPFGGSFNLSCFLEITNEDGESYRSEISQLKFDFYTQVETIEITDFKITPTGSGSTRLTYLQEGANLTLNCHISPYTAKDLELKLYKKVSGSGNWELFSSEVIECNSEKKDWYGNYKYENEMLTVYPGNIEYVWAVGPIPELISNSYDWKLEIDQKSYEVQKDAIAHSDPIILINEGNLNQASAELSVNLNENLVDTETLTGVTIVRSNNLAVLTVGSIETFKNREDSSFIYERTSTEPVPAFLQVKIEYKTTVNQGNYSVTHESESNLIYIYSSAPTVSYRENCVGINTSAPDAINGHSSEAVLMISPALNKNKVYIIGNKSTARIQMDDTVGLVNFVVDGGSWTNITGGFTPGTVPGGDIGDMLAKIAYTGEIGDAVQYASEPIIIISGGGAPV